MKIAVVAIGTRGDVEPHSALCHGLLEAGYDARLCAPNDFTETLRERRIPMDPIPVSFRQLCGSEGGSGLFATGGNGIRFLREMKAVAVEVGKQVITGIRKACADADAVCYSPMGLPAFYFARERGIPAFSTSLQPLGRTGSHSNPMMPMPDWTPAFVNRLSYRVAEQMFWQMTRPLLQPYVGNRLPLGGPFRELYRQPSPALFGYSPLVAPPPGDWKPWMHATGYWTNGASGWQPPTGLEEFLNGGAAVCVGFGSMHGNRIARIFDTALDAVTRSGRRAVVLTGWSGYEGRSAGRDGNVFVTEAAPHGWLFPRVTAVIHHGGAGTTAAALRAGIPSVILPFFFDQSFWGRCLARRGLGPPPIPFHGLSADALARALVLAEGSREMRDRVYCLSKRLQQENGVGRAVDIIGEALDGHA